MGVRFSSDIRREGGELTAGRFLLSGPVADIVAAANETSQRYSDNGWREDERVLQSNRAAMTFTKDARTVRVEIDRQQGSNAWLTLAVREGKNREVRRALQAVGLVVNRLIRVGYGPFQLGDLEPGTVEEVRAKVLREQLGLERPKPTRPGPGPGPGPRRR